MDKFKSGEENMIFDNAEKAWRLARDIVCSEEDGGFDKNKLAEIFGTTLRPAVLNSLTYQEALEKIKHWEKNNSVQVNDIVRCTAYGKSGDVFGVVVRVRDGGYAEILTSDCENIYRKYSEIEKTGQTADIWKFLNGLGGATCESTR